MTIFGVDIKINIEIKIHLFGDNENDAAKTAIINHDMEKHFSYTKKMLWSHTKMALSSLWEKLFSKKEVKKETAQVQVNK